MSPPIDLQEVLESEIKYVHEIYHVNTLSLIFGPPESGIFVCRHTQLL